jgi:activator of HSP90 ATPase
MSIIAILQGWRNNQRKVILKTKTINQTVIIRNASSSEIYEILMDSEKHAELVNSTAEISTEIGGKFEVYDGYIKGTNIELIKNRKIVQYWRGDEDCWPEDHFSKLTINLEKVNEGTKINLVQESVPEECYDDFNKGWYEFYWNPLKELFEPEHS